MKKAVITGDIIQSRRMSVDNRIKLTKFIEDMLETWNKTFDMKSEIYRGDSFQCLLNNPAHALRVALLLKTAIRSGNPSQLFEMRKKNKPTKIKRVLRPVWIFDARIAVGIGEVDAQTNKLATSGGEVFQLSGNLLDKMKDVKQSIGIATNDKYENEFKTESILLDAIISKTTALQCQVINGKLLNLNEITIGRTLKIAQSAVNQRSSSGNWNAIDTIVKRFEYIYSHE